MLQQNVKNSGENKSFRGRRPDKETEANYYSCVAVMLEGETTWLIKNNTEKVDSDNFIAAAVFLSSLKK